MEDFNIEPKRLEDAPDMHSDIPFSEMDEGQQKLRIFAAHVQDQLEGSPYGLRKVHDYDFVIGREETPVKMVVDMRNLFGEKDLPSTESEGFYIVLFESELPEVYDNEQWRLHIKTPMKKSYYPATAAAIAAFVEEWI